VVLMFFSLMYSANIGDGFKRLNVLLPIVILPVVLIYFQPTYSKKQYYVFLITFVISNLLFLCLSIYYLINTSVLECYYEISQLSFLRKVTYLWNIPFKTLLWCSRQYDLPSFFIHKTYNSLNLLIASVFVISLIFK